MPPWYPLVAIQCEPTNKLQHLNFQYPTYMKDTNFNAHIKVFKKAIRANREIMEPNIIDLFGFTLKDSILEWGKNFIQNHPNYTFKELEQAFSTAGLETIGNLFKLWKNKSCQGNPS